MQCCQMSNIMYEYNCAMIDHGPLTRYVKLGVAHAPGMSGTFCPPPWFSDPDMHHDTCVTHVPWCMPRSLLAVSFDVGGGENVPGIPGVCATVNYGLRPEQNGSILQNTFWNAISLMKIIVFLVKFHWYFFIKPTILRIYLVRRPCMHASMHPCMCVCTWWIKGIKIQRNCMPIS